MLACRLRARSSAQHNCSRRQLANMHWRGLALAALLLLTLPGTFASRVAAARQDRLLGAKVSGQAAPARIARQQGDGDTAADVSPTCDKCLTYVLPTHLRDFARSTMTLATIQTYGNSTLALEILLIVPEVAARVLGQVLGSGHAIPVQVVPEAEVMQSDVASLGKIRHFDHYNLQMALKLYVAYMIKTPFYITLDSDVLLTKPLTAEMVFPEPGKAIYRGNTRSKHDFWWDETEEMMDLHCLPTDPGAKLFGVTPAVMNTDIARKTTDYIKDHFGNKTLKALLSETRSSLKWTEYTAYRAMACKLGTFDDVHAEEPTDGPIWYCGLWNLKEMSNGIKLDSRCLFWVVQGNTDVPVNQVAEDVKSIFPAARSVEEARRYSAGQGVDRRAA